MIKVYVYKGIISHGIRFLPGTSILILYCFLVLREPQILGIQEKYDSISHDVLSFATLLAMFCVVLLQFFKSYLIFFPSTHITFDHEKIELEERFSKTSTIFWSEIEAIDLDIGDNRLLIISFVKSDGEIIKCYMKELWLLSISVNWCVRYNFYKLIAIADVNLTLKSKLNPEQLQFMYAKTQILRVERKRH